MRGIDGGATPARVRFGLGIGLVLAVACSEGAGNPADPAPQPGSSTGPTEEVAVGTPCLSDVECGTGWCAFSDGVCGAQGFCRRRTPDLQCPDLAEPVCGCDGVTYPNGCASVRAAISVAAEGPCPETPSTPDPARCGGSRCDADQFCDYTDGSCGNGETPAGACVTANGVCTDSAQPVCGCDGVTYETPCAARRAAVSIARLGGC